MPSPDGHVVLASAGSGKTTWIAQQVREHPHERALIATFTTTNSGRVTERLWREAGRLPEWTRIRTWFTFLLEDLVRPYQNATGRIPRVAGINLVARRSTRGVPKTSWTYWFDSAGCVYNDKISEFAIRCDTASDGAVLRRLARLYDRIYIDEVQDLAGYDLDLIERILKAGIRVTMVGDPRQVTYSTNMSGRYKKFRGVGIAQKFEEWKEAALCVIVEHSHSFRCRPEICRVADHLFPDFPAMQSRNKDVTHHDGVFLVKPEEVRHYIADHRPAVLRWNSLEKCQGLAATNFGESKGQEYERVLVFPTGPIRKWIASGDPSHVQASQVSLAKLYVAVTRARQSVGFVHDGEVGIRHLLSDEGLVAGGAPSCAPRVWSNKSPSASGPVLILTHPEPRRTPRSRR